MLKRGTYISTIVYTVLTIESQNIIGGDVYNCYYCYLGNKMSATLQYVNKTELLNLTNKQNYLAKVSEIRKNLINYLKMENLNA